MKKPARPQVAPALRRYVTRSHPPRDPAALALASPKPARAEPVAAAAFIRPAEQHESPRRLATLGVVALALALVALAVAVSSPSVARGGLAHVAERRLELAAAGLSLFAGLAVAFLLSSGG